MSVFSGNGITINGSGIQVVLKGLTINGQGGANGITITNAGTVHVENCVIANMGGYGINQIAGALYVKDTIARSNNAGVFVQGTAGANLDHVRLEGNFYGLFAHDGAQASIQDSVATGNSYGVLSFVTGGSAATGISVTRSLISFNGNSGVYAFGDSGPA